jgi:hypothetical protein
MSRRERSSSWNRTQALSSGTIGTIVVRDRSTCAYCARVLTRSEIQLDHVLPRVEGGRDRADNLVVACASCNQSRGDGPVPEHARAEVARRLALPLDREAGRALADKWYPGRRESQREAMARLREHRRYLGEGLEGTAFPFGALANGSQAEAS